MPGHRMNATSAKMDVGQALAQSDLQLDPFEEQFLDIARRFIIALAFPESLAWVDAFRRAETAFPPPFGATIASAILIAIREMQLSRFHPGSARVALHTVEPQRISEEERHLMRAFQSVRRHKHSDAHAHAILLCEGGDCHAFLSALERVAIITGDVDVPHYNNAI